MLTWTPASAGVTERGQGDASPSVIPAEAGIQVLPCCHSVGGRNPGLFPLLKCKIRAWIPAFAGMTKKRGCHSVGGRNPVFLMYESHLLCLYSGE